MLHITITRNEVFSIDNADYMMKIYTEHTEQRYQYYQTNRHEMIIIRHTKYCA